jgi:hypothetical protein
MHGIYQNKNESTSTEFTDKRRGCEIQRVGKFDAENAKTEKNQPVFPAPSWAI